MTITRLRPTYTFDEDRLAQLRAVVPEAFADGKIDWDTLRDLLGDHLEDPAVEHFGLSWPGKHEARRLASQPSRGALVPVPGEGVNEDTTRNIFVEGENLEVLKLLLKSYAGRVKMIYIDPPYNTGNDFIYSDNYTETKQAHLLRTDQADEAGFLVSNPRTSGRYHSNWLSMMYPRLQLARNFLRPDGVIFVSIDDHEVHNLRVLMAEVFGEENFVATVIWQKVYSPKNSARQFSEDHDYVVVFAKDAASWTPSLLPRTEDMDARYSNPDNDPRGPWKPSGLDARNYYGRGIYSITSPSGRIIAGPPSGSYWRVSEEKFWQMDRDNRIWWGNDGNSIPAIKRFLSEVKQGRVPQTLWRYDEVGHTQEAKKELLQFVTFDNTDNVLDTLKPVRLICRMLELATDSETEDIVLDFFSGSASTAHGVLEQNRRDGGNRRFVVVQFPESLPDPEPKLKTIADIGKERIRNAISQMQRAQADQLPLDSSAPADLGFRVYRLDRSHFKPWTDYTGDDVAALQVKLDFFEDPLVDGWQPANLLVEIMLVEGFPLDSTVTRKSQFTANDVRLVESDFHEHRLWVCLDTHVEPATVQALALADNDIFICLDSALDDETKLRLSDRSNLKTI